MSKPASATTPKTTLPTVSAWARGPPQNAAASSSSPRPQSPATPQHQRKPSGLFPPAPAANALKDGVAVRPGAGAGAPAASRTAGGSQVVFGSLDDPSATLSSSPAAPPAPPISTATKVQSFGSIPVTPATPSSTAAPPLPHTPLKPNGAAANGRPGPSSSASASTASTPAPSTPGTPGTGVKMLPKVDVRSLFMKTSAPSPASPTTKAVPEVSAPAPRHPQAHQLPHPGSAGPQFANFPPHMRPGSSGPPRSPQFNRAVPNGMPRPPGPPGAPQAMGSPRLAPQQVPPQGMPPPQQGMQPGMQPGAPMWVPQQGAYYAYTPYYGYIQPGPPPPGPDGQPQPHPHWMQGAPPPQVHMGAPPPPHAVASPRTQPPPLAVPPVPPPTSSTPPVTTAPPPQAAQQQNARPVPTPMSPQAPSFVPRTTPRAGGIRIVNPSSGAPVQLPNKENGAGTPSSTPVATAAPALPDKTENRRSVIRIESPADKAKREEEEREKKRKDDEAKKKVEDERRKKEEDEKARKEAEERKKKEAAEEKARKEEAERKRKLAEAEAAKRKAEEERKKKEADEAEAARKKAAEEEAAAAAAAATAAAAAAEVKRKADEEEAKRVAEEERKKKADAEAEAEAEAQAEAKAKEEAADKLEEEEKKDQETALTSSPTPAPPVVLKPSAPDTRRRPGPINIDAARAPMTPGPMSALATARIITDINQIQYPDNIKSPRVELNMNAKEGKFRYDRDFLMQFMEVCKEKPDQLPPAEALGLEPIGAPDSRTRGRNNMPPPISRQNSTHGLGFMSSGGGGSGFKNPMGSFNTGGSSRPSSISGGPGGGGVSFPRGAPMARTPSQSGSNSGRTRSQRGKVRDKTLSNAQPQSLAPVLQSQFEPVQALQHSENAWSTQRRGVAATGETAEVVERKVKSLLNKLTMERFDSISDQIIEWANKSEKEKDGRTLIQVIRLVFEKATDEATWSHMYARLCRKMMEQISDGVMDEGIKNAEGQPIKGGLLFRKYLLNRCQEDFERGWSVQAQTAAAAREKAEDDAAKKKNNEASQGQGEEELYSDEYYAAQKAKRRGLGLVRFIGELFKLQMLTERIMHECIKKLLSNVDNPGEEEIESICKLLSTVGQALDTSKARSHMDIYFKRMRDLSDSPNIDSRMRFMLQDVIELRERKWIPRNATAAPTTLSAVHDLAAKERAAAEKESASRMSTMSRGGSRRGDNRSDYGSHTGADGWSTPASRAPASKAGDLSQFGKISKSASGVVSLGPASVFAGKKGGDKREHTASLSRSTSSNPFAALTQNPGENAADAPSTSRSRKPSVDFSQSGLSEGGGRRKLQLLPRSKPLEEVSATPEKTETPEESEDENAAPTPEEEEPPKKVLSEAQIKKQIEEDTKEFFAIKKLDESEQYFESLPEDQRYRFVDVVFAKAVEGKDADATLVGNLFALVLEKGKVTPDILEKGFSGPIEFLEDVVVDSPAAYALTAKMLHLSKFDEARVQRLAEKIAVDGEPLVAPKDRLLKEFSKLSS